MLGLASAQIHTNLIKTPGHNRLQAGTRTPPQDPSPGAAGRRGAASEPCTLGDPAQPSQEWGS